MFVVSANAAAACRRPLKACARKLTDRPSDLAAAVVGNDDAAAADVKVEIGEVAVAEPPRKTYALESGHPSHTLEFEFGAVDKVVQKLSSEVVHFEGGNRQNDCSRLRPMKMIVTAFAAMQNFVLYSKLRV